MKDFNKRVYEIVKMIPYGAVANYGQIARLAGSPRASRIVGYAVHAVPDPMNTPWHRVVLKDGSLAKFENGKNLQYKLLKAEGVGFSKDKKVDMKKHLWDEVEFEMNEFL